MGKMKEVEAAMPAVIVFGKDEADKPHGSWFAAADAELAERAAALMAMRVLPVTTAEHRAIALELPEGRVFASGRGFVPFTKASLYERLTAFPEAFQPAAPAEAGADPLPPATGTPTHWNEVIVGSLVLAHEGEGYAGWYESIVVEDRGGSTFVLRWRDWPDEPAFERRADQLALLPPGAPLS